MKKVILIHSAYLSARNGANTVMRSLLESKDLFSRYGIEIYSLSLDNFTERSFEPNSKDTVKNEWRARIKRLLKVFAQRSTWAAELVMYLSDIRPAKRIASYYVNTRPDSEEVVFFHSLIPCYYYLKMRKYRQHTVVVCHTNGDNFKMDRIYYPALERSFLYRKLQKMEKYVIDHADKINFVAEMAKVKFLELHPDANPDKVSFIYNGVLDTPIINKPKNVVMEFCCVASVSVRKGQHYIVDALKSLSIDKIPEVHFTFVGEGPEREKLEKEVVEFGLSKYVSFIGVSYDVDRYLANSDAFILPSEDEGLPMAIIEAMRASLPIVSTRVGGIPEMITQGSNGLLIDPCVKDICEILIHLKDYNWRMMGENARKTYEEKFSITQMVEGYAKLLNC